MIQTNSSCTKSTINVTAEVRENGRGSTETADIVIPLGASQIFLTFTEGTGQLFRAGLPYKARVSLWNTELPRQ